MLLNTYRRFDQIADKKEKKNLLKGHIYLDWLITFFRLPGSIEESPDELARKLSMPSLIVDHILNDFTQISVKNQSQMDQPEYASSNHEFKYVKSKENTKKLMCHILGIAVLMHRGQPMKASSIAQVLKKEVADLRSYFQELGLHYTPFKENGVDDLSVQVSNEKAKPAKKEEKKITKQSKGNKKEKTEPE